MQKFDGLAAVKAAPTPRSATLALGKNPREVAFVDEAAELGDIKSSWLGSSNSSFALSTRCLVCHRWGGNPVVAPGRERIIG
jgi:hypothetical protein